MVNYNDKTLKNETFTGDQSSIPFINTILENCIFSECNLDYCQFLSSSFHSCEFKNCSFTRTDFNSSTFEDIKISNCVFFETNLSVVDFKDYTFFDGNENYSNCLFVDTNLSGLILANKEMKNCNFTGTDLTNCDFTTIDFRFSTFDTTKLTNIKLSSINFIDTTFQQLDFSNLDLSDNITLSNNSNNLISSNENTTFPTIELDGNIISYEIRQSVVSDESGTSQLSYLIGPYIDFNEKNLNGISFTDLNLTGTILTTDNLQNCTSGNVTFNTTEPILKDGYKLVSGYIIGPFVNIVNADLSGEDLSSVNFESVKTNNNSANNLTIFPTDYTIYGIENNGITNGVVVGPKVILIQADISGIDLSSANFLEVRSGLTIGDDNTILPTGFKLEQGYILGPYVDLQQVTLSNLDITNTDLRGCVFQNTKCTGGVQSNTKTKLPEGYVLKEGYLLGPSINFSDTDFQSKVIDFSSVNLSGSRSKNITNYENVTFPQGYSIVSDILLGPSLSLVNDIVITGKTLTSISFTDTDFTSAEFTNCIFQDCSFDGTIFNGTNFTNSSFPSCSFNTNLMYQNINFTSVSFDVAENIFTEGKVFSECSFENMDFSSYSLDNKLFQNINFKNARLGTDLSNSTLKICDLSDADLSQSTLTNVSATQISSNENTKLPENYIIAGEQLISTAYTETENKIFLESTQILNNDTRQKYIRTMLDLVTSAPTSRIVQKPILILTEKLNIGDDKPPQNFTEIIDSNTEDSTVRLENVNTHNGYYITLYDIGEEVIIPLNPNPHPHLLSIRRINLTEYIITKDDKSPEIVTKGYQGEYYGFIFTIGNSVSAYYIGNSNICFPAGEFVLTNDGYVDFKDLDVEKHTIYGRKIQKIFQTSSLKKKLVQIEKNALGDNIPNKRTLISQNHKILHNGHWYYAKQLVGFPMVHFVEYEGQTLYNVQLETYYSMNVNNMNVETLKRNLQREHF